MEAVMKTRECSTQAEADAAATAGDVIVWRAGILHAYGSATVYARGSVTVHAYDSATVDAYASATVHASDSATAYASDSATAYAYDSAVVKDGETSAPLSRAHPRIVLGPLGSRAATLGVSLPSDGSEPVVYAGCWSGRLSDFSVRVNEVYPTGRYGDEYRATIAYIRAIAAVQQEAA